MCVVGGEGKGPKKPKTQRTWKQALTMFWQSSKVPSTATHCTFLSGTVVICRSWIAEVRPLGYRMKHRTFAFPRSP